MSLITLATLPVTRQQIDTALRGFLPVQEADHSVMVRQPFNMPKDRIQVEMKGRAEVEHFMLRLAMIVSGDALSPVTGMPTVVDAEEILIAMSVFRGRLEELEHSDESFILTLELAESEK